MPTEADLRDHLASNLDLIEPGLVLEKKEKHLKNPNGAAGFVDIFARDGAGKVVIIEIKMTKATSREAVQELSKYAALLRANSLVKETEYRLIVLSVDWTELRVPFSEFFHNTRYHLLGGRIVTGPDGLPTAVEWVTPLPKQAERKFSRRHFIWEYSDGERANVAAEAAAERMRDLGLRNFIVALVKLDEATEGISHLVYFAQQEEAPEFYWNIINGRFGPEELEEFNGWLEDIDDPGDVLGELADKAWDSSGEDGSFTSIMNADGAQISHPEKAQYWLAENVAAEVRLIRVGLFQTSTLSDRELLAELRGTQGGSTYVLDMAAHLSSRPEIDALLRASDEIFFFNSVWRTAVRDIVGYAQHVGAAAIRLKAHSNDDILKTLVWGAFGELGHVPGFVLEVAKADKTEAFVGGVQWDKRCPDWNDLVETFFEGDPERLMWHRHFGSIRPLNGEIMEAIGMSYCLFHTRDVSDGTLARPVAIQGVAINDRKIARSALFDVLSCEDFMQEAITQEMARDMSFSQMVNLKMQQQGSAFED